MAYQNLLEDAEYCNGAISYMFLLFSPLTRVDRPPLGFQPIAQTRSQIYKHDYKHVAVYSKSRGEDGDKIHPTYRLYRQKT